jgi:hypothetical protein
MQSNGAITYAAVKTFTYANEAQEITLEFLADSKTLPEGSYLMELIIEGETAATKSFDLK